METQIWIISQIFIDIVMIALLLWFVRLHRKRGVSWKDFEVETRKSESILSEMRQIGQSLEQNLEVKKELSRHILNQLDQALKRAEESYKQIYKIIPKTGITPTDRPFPAKETDQTRASINGLLEKGKSREEIAKNLGISVGEIELFLKLSPQNNNSKSL